MERPQPIIVQRPIIKNTPWSDLSQSINNLLPLIDFIKNAKAQNEQKAQVEQTLQNMFTESAPQGAIGVPDISRPQPTMQPMPQGTFLQNLPGGQLGDPLWNLDMNPLSTPDIKRYTENTTGVSSIPTPQINMTPLQRLQEWSRNQGSMSGGGQVNNMDMTKITGGANPAVPTQGIFALNQLAGSQMLNPQYNVAKLAMMTNPQEFGKRISDNMFPKPDISTNMDEVLAREVQAKHISLKDAYELKNKAMSNHWQIIPGTTTLFDPATAKTQETGANRLVDPSKTIAVTGQDGKNYIMSWNSETNKYDIQQALASTKQTDIGMPFTQDATNALAQRFGTTGELPGLGLGRAATNARVQIINQWAKDLSNTGTTAADQVTKQAAYKASTSELAKLQSQRGMVMAFAETTGKNLDLVEKLSNEVDRTGSPIVNEWILKGKRSITGNPEVSKFDAAVRTAINEYARVTTTATGGSVTSDMARKEVEDMLNVAQTPQQVSEVISLLRREINNRKEGYDMQIDTIKSNIKGLSAEQFRKPGQNENNTLKKKYGLE
jgi:hypothetical protein